ncbi:hypothetical protein KsCSTR_12810 [Candidatus Kuenenia stuttgartiensis]|uniref:Uncharacterized protein n=1 Tax=Kuenenia stuttgartiensis TaxID=174633 RepID=A0A6G7GM16_KUEST|nr:hypothetical protein KsCSTR_12810 [Candidatus Kuenenia stuttgartiensis]
MRRKNTIYISHKWYLINVLLKRLYFHLLNNLRLIGSRKHSIMQ